MQALAVLGGVGEGRLLCSRVYLGTEYEAYANSYAGAAAKCQHVVHTEHGTVVYMATTGCVYSPNPKKDLLQRLSVFLPPWVAQRDREQAFDASFPATSASPSASQALTQVAAQPLDFSVSSQ